MSHSLQTENYDLPLFQPEDKPSWIDDFNGAMQKLDEAVKDISENNTPAISLPAKLVGNNTSSNLVNLSKTTTNNTLSISRWIPSTNTYNTENVVLAGASTAQAGLLTSFYFEKMYNMPTITSIGDGLSLDNGVLSGSSTGGGLTILKSVHGQTPILDTTPSWGQTFNQLNITTNKPLFLIGTIYNFNTSTSVSGRLYLALSTTPNKTGYPSSSDNGLTATCIDFNLEARNNTGNQYMKNFTVPFFPTFTTSTGYLLSTIVSNDTSAIVQLNSIIIGE